MPSIGCRAHPNGTADPVLENWIGLGTKRSLSDIQNIQLEVSEFFREVITYYVGMNSSQQIVPKNLQDRAKNNQSILQDEVKNIIMVITHQFRSHNSLQTTKNSELGICLCINIALWLGPVADISLLNVHSSTDVHCYFLLIKQHFWFLV